MLEPVEIFGTMAVAAMACCYALEDRGPHFILLFAVACLAASTYAIAIEAWPFAVVEALWGLLAWQRWRSTLARNPLTDPRRLQ